MNSQELALVLKAKDEASAVLQRAADSSAASTDKMKSGFSGLGLAAKAAAGLIGGALVGALADAARAAAEDAASVASLEMAVANTGDQYEDFREIIEARIAAGQRLAFSDDQTRASLQILTEATGNVATALGVQSLAMDISRAKHISLEAASTLVGKVVSGNVGVLKKFGVTLGENATSTEALAALQAKFGRQAETYAGTTSAAIDRMKDSIDEWKEGIGAALGPAQGLIAMLPGLSVGMTALGGAMTTTVIPAMKALRVAILTTVLPALGAAVVAAAPVILAIGILAAAALFLATAWQKNWGDIQGTVKAAGYALQAVIGKIGEFLGWLGDRAGDVAHTFGEAFNWIVDRARDVFNMLPGFIRDRIGDFGDFGRGMIRNFQNGVADNSPSMLDKVGSIARTIADTVGGVAHDMVEVGGDMMSNLGGGINSMKDWLGGQLSNLGGMIPKDILGGAGDIEGIGLTIPTAIAKGIEKGTSVAKSAAAEMGKAIAKTFQDTLDAMAAMLRSGAVADALKIGRGVAPGASTADQLLIGTNNLVQTGSGGNGEVSESQLRAGPKNTIMVDGRLIPMFGHGGTMARTGLAHLEAGEHVSRDGESGLTININGPVYGMLDFEQQIKRIVRDTFPQRARA